MPLGGNSHEWLSDFVRFVEEELVDDGSDAHVALLLGSFDEFSIFNIGNTDSAVFSYHSTSQCDDMSHMGLFNTCETLRRSDYSLGHIPVCETA